MSGHEGTCFRQTTLDNQSMVLQDLRIHITKIDGCLERIEEKYDKTEATLEKMADTLSDFKSLAVNMIRVERIVTEQCSVVEAMRGQLAELRSEIDRVKSTRAWLAGLATVACGTVVTMIVQKFMD